MTDCLHPFREVDVACGLPDGHDGPHQFTLQWDDDLNVISGEAP